MTSERASWAWRGCGSSSRELVSHGRVFFLAEEGEDLTADGYCMENRL